MGKIKVYDDSICWQKFKITTFQILVFKLLIERTEIESLSGI